MRRLPQARWQKGRVSEVEDGLCTLATERMWYFGRIYTWPGCRGCVSVRTWGWRGRWERASYHLVCSGLVSSSRLCPGPSWGPQAGVWKEHHQQTWMLAGPDQKLLFSLSWGSSSAPFDLLLPLNESLGPTSMGGSGSSPRTESWFWALLWRAPAGVDLGLHYGSSSSSLSPVRIRSVLKKEVVCEWEGRRMAAKCWWGKDKSMKKSQGTEEKVATRE